MAGSNRHRDQRPSQGYDIVAGTDRPQSQRDDFYTIAPQNVHSTDGLISMSSITLFMGIKRIDITMQSFYF